MLNDFTKVFLKIFNNPKLLMVPILSNRLFRWLPSKYYIHIIYYCRTGKKLNLKEPRTFNEKLQWLKLNDIESDYTSYVDKYMVRDFIAKTIGPQYLIPLYGVYNNVEEIDFNKLPNEFVLKCTHDSGGVVICNDKKNFNIKNAKKKLNRYLRRNFYYRGRELPYKDVEPKIICEKYMVDEDKGELKDYKFFCFDGVPLLIEVDYERSIRHKRNLYNMNWEFINATIQHPNDPDYIIEKPENLDEMVRIASVLSARFKHVRVDLYSIDNNIYFGELTLYHGSGFHKFTPESLEVQMGEWLKLSSEVSSNN